LARPNKDSTPRVWLIKSGNLPGFRLGPAMEGRANYPTLRQHRVVMTLSMSCGVAVGGVAVGAVTLLLQSNLLPESSREKPLPLGVGASITEAA
jgi:hypothetical protein